MQENESKQEQSDLDSEISSEITFLQEKIKERPVNRKKLARRTAITAMMAMVFGLVACVTFLLLEPVINRMLYPEEPAEIVRFPEEEQEVNPEDMAADEEELQIIRAEKEAGNQESNAPGQEGATLDGSAGGESGQNGMPGSDGGTDNPDMAGAEGTGRDETAGSADENASGSSGTGMDGSGGDAEILPEEAAKAVLLENYQGMYDVLGELRAEVEKSIVSVNTVTSDVNWINDTLESTGVTSGLIVADNGRELLILAGYGELKDADSISVSFGEEQKEATVKEVDRMTDLAVLAVPLSSLSEKQKEEIIYASLGSSAGRTLVGQPVMAIGSPVGIRDSACYGMVTSQGAPLGLLDSNYKLLTTDIYGSKSASGVLANMRGEIVGILYHYENSDMENRLCAIGISELKKTIEKLSNGEKMAYLGVQGAELNASVYREYELPRGAFVTNVDMDSPAMQAGLQNGDIITKVDDADIVSYAEFVNILMRARPEQSLKLTVVRQSQGKGEYQEMILSVTLQGQE